MRSLLSIRSAGKACAPHLRAEINRAAGEARIEPQALRQLADWYVETSPALIRCGWGLERNRNGGSAAAAVLALPTVAGKFRVRGGGYSMSNSSAFGVRAASSIDTRNPRHGSST